MAFMKFTKDHEWIKTEGDDAFIGITDYAQKALGEIVFVELPQTGAQVEAGDGIGTVESVKTVSDIYTPIDGEVVQVNTALEEVPGMINEAPYENWIAALKMSDPSQLDALMDEAAYKQFCEEVH
jgi:glycine cleavage system H protein